VSTEHAIATLLAQRCGLQASATDSRLEQVVSARMAALGVSDQGAYVSRLLASEPEWAALVEAYVVPETWFLREPTTLHNLTEKAVALPRSGRPVRILSIPCASGEEPYSIAICLKAAGLNHGEAVVHGADISQALLARAVRATYSSRSFRSTSPSWRAQWFEPVGDEWRVREEVRSLVELVCVNLAQPSAWIESMRYDLIVCRNVFAYLTPAAREAALTLFVRILRPQGALFTSPADALTIPRERFRLHRTGAGSWLEPIRPDEPVRGVLPTQSSAGRVEVAGTSPSEPALRGPGHTHRPRPPARPPLQRASTSFKDDGVPRVPPSALPAASRVTPEPPRSQELRARELEHARACANRGELAQAAEVCERLLAAQGPHPEVYYLLALMASADNRLDEVHELLRRALYLEPAHRASLELAAAVSHRQGDRTRAHRFEARLRRLGAS
jgi:chemotaxis protein methyltransferase WspC